MSEEICPKCVQYINMCDCTYKPNKDKQIADLKKDTTDLKEELNDYKEDLDIKNSLLTDEMKKVIDLKKEVFRYKRWIDKSEHLPSCKKGIYDKRNDCAFQCTCGLDDLLKDKN